MKLVARAPIENVVGVHPDQRPGDVFEAPADVGARLVKEGKAEEHGKHEPVKPEPAKAPEPKKA
jgi:hypothetical protein